jgi:hypothetical protein
VCYVPQLAPPWCSLDKQGLAGKIAANKAADQWQPGWLPLVFKLSENELEG